MTNIIQQMDPSTPPDENENKSGKEMEKMKQLAPIKPPPTLAEITAKSLAQAWSRDNSLLPDFCDNTSSEMGLIFQIQIAIYLRGIHLVQWIQAQGGLGRLSTCAWPDLFQKLLTAVFVESGRDFQRLSIQNSLRFLLTDYRKHLRFNQVKQLVLHQLGMTDWLPYGKTQFCENLMVFYYTFLDDRRLNFRAKLPVVMPLPFPLQIPCLQVNAIRKKYYTSSASIQKNQLEWHQSVTEQERLFEKEGKELSAPTAFQQKALYETYCEKYTPAERFISCISTMVRNQTNGAYPVVLITALFSLLHPFYSYKNQSDAPLLRRFRIDIFWFLSRALCSFYARLDLPLACLHLAQNSLGPFPCLSDRMHEALLFQNMAVQYGHWEPAQQVFDEWFYQVPPASSLFEELVFIHMTGLFWQMENLLVEYYITQIFHKKCTDSCCKKYLSPSYAQMIDLNFQIKRLAGKCMADKTIQTRFFSDLQIVIYLCCYFDLTLNTLLFKDTPVQFDRDLRLIWQRLENSQQTLTSRHLLPFIKMIPYFSGSQYYWDKLTDNHLNYLKKTMQSCSLVEHPKPHADWLFSLLTCMLYHNRHDPFPHIIRATLEAYLKSTAERHYRIPLLQKLQKVYSDPAAYQLSLENQDGQRCHPDSQETSALGMTLKDIQAFSETLRDALNDFEQVDLSNDDKFCLYLKRRDPLMPAWIDFGLESLRFSDCL